ncbi:unnamed protein product, partial [marine sediment metagenome]
MKEAVLYGVKEFKIIETSKPTIGPDDVFIKVKACGICGSDMHSYRRGASSIKTPQKLVLGHEFSGEVTEVGSEVTEVQVGDRVGVEPLVGCGQCYFCRCGDYHLCDKLEHLGGQRKGGFAEYALIPQDKVYKLPENISFEEAALLDAPGETAIEIEPLESSYFCSLSACILKLNVISAKIRMITAVNVFFKFYNL